MSAHCSRRGTNRTVLISRISRTVVGVALLMVACVAAAQVTVVRSRNLSLNGRTVQEIRLGNEPGNSRTLMRALVVTNGPTAGTTTLLTAVADANVWVDSAAPAPVFTPVIASGTVFSIGGGCLRGNQLDFPFINGNRPRILRVIGGSPSVITPAIPGGDFFDSADCVVSGDGTRTFFIFSNRSLQRLWFFVDTGGAADLNGPQVSFSPVKSPLQGGLRSSISIVPGTNRTVALVFMATNGVSRWMQFNSETINVDFNCPAGVQSPPPSGFTTPRRALVANRTVHGDFNGDGQYDLATITPVNPPPPASCTKLPPSTTVGPVAGTGYDWSEAAVARHPETGQTDILAGILTFFGLDPALATTVPGPHAGRAGSFAACAADNTEVPQVLLSMGVGDAFDQILAIQTELGRSQPPPPGQELVFRSGIEDDDTLVRVFCSLFSGLVPPPP